MFLSATPIREDPIDEDFEELGLDPAETMTKEEKYIAFTFLKRRFPDYTVEEIIMSLFQDVQNGKVFNSEYPQEEFGSQQNSMLRVDRRSTRGGGMQRDNNRERVGGDYHRMGIGGTSKTKLTTMAA